MDCKYWEKLTEILKTNQIVIERRKGTSHPKYPSMIYPVDYGYIANTNSMDNHEIDIFIGTHDDHEINGILCTIDILKNDSEIKVLFNCSDKEMKSISEFLESENMSCLLIRK